MVLVSEWSEELLAEYLEIAGYFVKTNHPIQISKGGGRGEIDMLGIKVDNSRLEIFQIEVGGISQRYNNKCKEIVNKKFGPAVANEIQQIAKDFGFQGNYVWTKWYVDVYEKGKRAKEWHKLKSKLSNHGIILKTLKEVFDEVKSEVNGWKRRYQTPKGNLPTIPERLWILKALESIKMF